MCCCSVECRSSSLPPCSFQIQFVGEISRRRPDRGGSLQEQVSLEAAAFSTASELIEMHFFHWSFEHGQPARRAYGACGSGISGFWIWTVE